MQTPEPADEAFPNEARTCTGFDGHECELVSTDEYDFEVNGWTSGRVSIFLIISFFSILFLLFFSFSCDIHVYGHLHATIL